MCGNVRPRTEYLKYLARDIFAHELNRGDAGEALCSAVSHTGPPGSLELTKERI